jgi:hypothetical protein
MTGPIVPPGHNAPNQPELEDVQGERAPLYAVPVDVQSVVYTRELPSRFGTPRSYFCDNVNPVKVLTPDPRRRSARIVSTDDDFYVGTDQQGVVTGFVRWPKNQPLLQTHADEVWVMLATQVSGRVSVLEEQWAG